MAEVDRIYIDFDNVPDNLPYDTSINYVSCKEDMDYDDLCTLESMIALFDHDKALDNQITNLKEKYLLKTINELKKEASVLNNTVKNIKDALMLMLYINPEEITEIDDCRNLSIMADHFIESLIDEPSILLKYIDEDVHISWPVRKGDEYINNGLRTKDAADNEDVVESNPASPKEIFYNKVDADVDGD